MIIVVQSFILEGAETAKSPRVPIDVSKSL